jgi:hypothetical protein
MVKTYITKKESVDWWWLMTVLVLIAIPSLGLVSIVTDAMFTSPEEIQHIGVLRFANETMLMFEDNFTICSQLRPLIVFVENETDMTRMDAVHWDWPYKTNETLVKGRTYKLFIYVFRIFWIFPIGTSMSELTEVES